ncbi:MAG: sulfatase-like hydrolase/transferase [Phycisphaerae bacterium]|nr:sulfatase-like hydrolase/transferase [Phycisphaerae bacterium]
MTQISDRIGISTHFLPSTHGEDVYDAIRAVHEAGFKGFEIVPTLDQAQLGFPENHPNVGIDLFDATSDEITRLKEALSVFDWVTVHSPHLDWNLSSANRHLRRLTWDYYDKCLEFAAELGATAMTYHGGQPTPGFVRRPERLWDHDAAFAEHLMPQAKVLGIPVGYEAGSLAYLKYVADRVDGWGINLDIGHAYMAAGTDEGFFAYIDEFAGRIAEVHMNGVNHYWGRFMEHQPPHLNNTIDYQRTFERLKEIGYEGPIVCEIQGQDIAQVVRHCSEAKDVIVGIWQGSTRLSQRWHVGESATPSVETRAASIRRSRPNIVLIVADDMGYGDIGAFGGDMVQTPGLDALAMHGICLRQHYSGSPVCAPARAALLTGRYPHRTGAIDTLEGRGLDRLSLRETTLADVLSAGGYATGLVGKWHLGALDPRYHPRARGFLDFVGFRGGWSDYWQWRLDYNGRFHKADGRYLTDVFTEEAVQFIDRHRDDPFFLHVTYNAPHFPLQVPDEDANPFRETGRFTEGVSLIYGMNRRMDQGIQRILDALERHGLTEDTLILFTSDNGPQFGGEGDMNTDRYNGHFNGCKGNVYEGGIRVPAILRWPAGLDGGRQSGAFMHFTDWFATLLQVAEVAVPKRLDLDGHGRLEVLRGEPDDVDPRRFWQWNRYTPVPNCNAAMRDGPWKLVCREIPEAMWLTEADMETDRKLKYEPEGITDICRDPEPERDIPSAQPPLLFNLEEDPYEQNDLSEGHPDRVRSMQHELENWFEKVESERERLHE